MSEFNSSSFVIVGILITLGLLLITLRVYLRRKRNLLLLSRSVRSDSVTPIVECIENPRGTRGNVGKF